MSAKNELGYREWKKSERMFVALFAPVYLLVSCVVVFGWPEISAATEVGLLKVCFDMLQGVWQWSSPVVVVIWGLVLRMVYF